MQRQRSLLALILLLVMAAIAVIVTIPVPLGLDLRGGSQLTIQVKPAPEMREITERDLEGVQKVVEGRVNGLGVSEPVIQTVGTDKILVQLPGVNDPEQAERVLGGTAQLEFRQQKPGTETQFFAFQASQAELRGKQEGLRGSDDEAAIINNQQELQRNKQATAELFESTDPPLNGKYLQDAYGEPTQGSNWNVAIRFNPKGGELFANLTKNLAGTGRSIGIFLDNELISAPVVGIEFADTGITGGAAVITGGFTPQEANNLGVQLRGGALPVPVEIAERRTVGATLGRDSIQSSIYAGIGGLILVLIFMVVYYRLPGLIADVSLVIYSLLTWASFALLGVTLTLPGIAGFILSIGMAVDANVLIFERTREELRAGKSLYRSVESGFYRAFSSILDSNVTTWIACAALFWFGSGLVKGFALTLALGVAVSMFTAITCSRTLMFLAITNPTFKNKRELFCPNLPALNKAEVAK
ncbi:protein translocase subunit SecD [Umezakia ovalisporum]|jgi:preprotein translocase subunit SecD|uniref:Protein translocase subunit SecD n=2 Tax=Umezakia ovalisporum TaxID=75695 RepID=A0AA43GXB5_9CYAN|nr:protein translocase subunit SecD [Umezakia ovalisporum]MDH6057938.1 protein translocase subunit SecD [Umezakia ovalisporum FSS-43]MDH6063020.1 protein translocase subunit SecD [Umezakia ovalisporum FSS-62]MDH6066859.1 protein translocase subunit SecD [Umezakia ovalisporum APH033B]MDH6071962.1 protein translocase subunit SecD [Umezakia ovalisporum CobakiLakeA]MDH6073322.1 protein translocase subunit SecD [Umezakia ovalisporum CS-1034]